MAILLFAPSYLISLFSYLFWEINDRRNNPDKVREASPVPEIEEFRRQTEKSTTALHLLSFLRRVALAAIVTFGRVSIVAQFIFVSTCSVLLIAFIGYKRPFQAKGERRLALWNEFTILIIYGQVLCQTDFVEFPDYRIKAGWSIIAIVTLAVIFNFGYVLLAEGAETFHFVRLTWRQTDLKLALKQMEKEQEEAQKYAEEKQRKTVKPKPNLQDSTKKSMLHLHDIMEFSCESDRSNYNRAVVVSPETKIAPQQKVGDIYDLVLPTGTKNVNRKSQRTYDRIMVNAPMALAGASHKKS